MDFARAGFDGPVDPLDYVVRRLVVSNQALPLKLARFARFD